MRTLQVTVTRRTGDGPATILDLGIDVTPDEAAEVRRRWRHAIATDPEVNLYLRGFGPAQRTFTVTVPATGTKYAGPLFVKGRNK